MNSYQSEDINEGNLLCLGKSHAYETCRDSECKKHAYLCQREKCICKKLHKTCDKDKRMSIQHLGEMVQQKFLAGNHIQKNIHQKIKIYKSRLNDIQALISQWTFDECNKHKWLTDLESTFLEAWRNGGPSTLVGQEIQAIRQLTSELKPDMKKISSVQETVNKALKSIETSIKQFEAVIKDNLSFKGEQIFLTSKIIQIQEEFLTIKNQYFPEESRLKRFNLLYRGSENNFLASEFHKSCDGQPNILVVAKNEKGIKFGAYTPLAGDSKGQNHLDKSGRSFIFNLTNNLKYNLNPHLFAIYSGQTMGPNFGPLPDFELIDRCDEKFSKWRVCSHYKNQYPNLTDSQLIRKMTGNSNGSPYYRVVQYEVWRVQFEPNQEEFLF